MPILAHDAGRARRRGRRSRSASRAGPPAPAALRRDAVTRGWPGETVHDAPTSHPSRHRDAACGRLSVATAPDRDEAERAHLRLRTTEQSSTTLSPVSSRRAPHVDVTATTRTRPGSDELNNVEIGLYDRPAHHARDDARPRLRARRSAGARRRVARQRGDSLRMRRALARRDAGPPGRSSFARAHGPGRASRRSRPPPPSAPPARSRRSLRPPRPACLRREREGGEHQRRRAAPSKLGPRRAQPAVFATHEFQGLLSLPQHFVVGTRQPELRR